MGAWIEIVTTNGLNSRPQVAPFMGAWIEIVTIEGNRVTVTSHLLWVRGLKYCKHSPEFNCLMSHLL